MPFEQTPEGWTVEVPDEDHMGPAMLRLNERQRRFVCALSVYGGDQTRAYAWAGYDNKSEGARRVNASRLANNDEVKEAIKEEAWRRLDYASLLAVSTMVELASPNNKDSTLRLKAADMLSKRTGFHEKSEMLVKHEDRRTTKELMDFIQMMSAKLGVQQLVGLSQPTPAAVTHQPVIDTTYEEVESSEGLEDLL